MNRYDKLLFVVYTIGFVYAIVEAINGNTDALIVAFITGLGLLSGLMILLFDKLDEIEDTHSMEETA